MSQLPNNCTGRSPDGGSRRHGNRPGKRLEVQTFVLEVVVQCNIADAVMDQYCAGKYWKEVEGLTAAFDRFLTEKEIISDYVIGMVQIHNERLV